ncbi:MAG: GLPGLI family protein [Raineya sp.]|nr:GLPGLI family protein [Raineya sp.]
MKYLFQSDGDFLAKLIITDTASHWQGEGPVDRDKIAGFLVKDDEVFMMKHFLKKKIFLRTFRIYQRSYYVADSLFPMKWILGKEKKKILGFPCKSATTTFRGRTYKAFYTEKIPLSDGPWKFGGLPGLILEIASQDGVYKWTAIEYSQNVSEKPRKCPNINKIQFLTWQEYVEAYKERVYRIWEKNKAEAKPGTSGGMMITEIEIFFPEFQTGKGLTW